MANKEEPQNNISSEKASNKEAAFFVQESIDDIISLPENQTIQPEKPISKLKKSSKFSKAKNALKIQAEKSSIKQKIRERNHDENSELPSTEYTIAEQRKKLDEVEQSVSKQNSKKRKMWNLIFFCLNIVIVIAILCYQLLNEDLSPPDGLRLNVWYLLVIILFFGLTMGTETFAIAYLLKQSSGKWKLSSSYKVAAIGRYYDCVTPMATGGQPFQISYLKSRGEPLHTSLSIPLAKYVFGQIAWVVLSFICLIISFTNKNFGTFVSVTSVLGFVFSSIMLFVTLFLSICKSLGRKLVVKTLRLLQKMKIVKNYDKQYERITKYISDFQDVMKQYAKSPKDFIVMLFLSFLKLFLNYSMPFFIVNLFMSLDGSFYFQLFVMTMLVDMSSSFFPLPGGTGMNEISFTNAFGSLIGQGNILVWVLLVWRFFSYYVYLVQGVSILSYDMAYGNRKYKWQVKKELLAEESAVFKQNQIDRFRAERAKRRKSKQKNNKLRDFI